MVKVGNRLEWAKWVALVCMVVDHAGSIYAWGSVPHLIGRVAAPVFVIAWAAQYGSDFEGSRLYRAAGRLLCWGVLAQIITPLESHQFQLNALVMFSVSALLWACLLDRLWFAAAVVFLVGGVGVEYGWIGQILAVSALLWWRHRSAISAAGLLLALLALCWLNGSVFAAVAPLVCALSSRLPALARSRVTFLRLYPAHLLLLRIAS